MVRLVLTLTSAAIAAFIIGACVSLVARAEDTINRRTNYTDRVVDVKETPLPSGCVVIETTLESKHGDNTQGTQRTQVDVRCPEEFDEIADALEDLKK